MESTQGIHKHKQMKINKYYSDKALSCIGYLSEQRQLNCLYLWCQFNACNIWIATNS